MYENNGVALPGAYGQVSGENLEIFVYEKQREIIPSWSDDPYTSVSLVPWKVRNHKLFVYKKFFRVSVSQLHS